MAGDISGGEAGNALNQSAPYAISSTKMQSLLLNSHLNNLNSTMILESPLYKANEISHNQRSRFLIPST